MIDELFSRCNETVPTSEVTTSHIIFVYLFLHPHSEECRGRHIFVSAKAVTWIPVENLHYLEKAHNHILALTVT